MSFFTLSEQLKEPYKGVFDRVYLYANVQEITEEESNDAMLNLYDVLFTAQAEQKPVEQIVGDDIEAFCQQYFDQRKLHRFLTSLPDRFFRWGKWIFGVEAFLMIGDWLTGQAFEALNLFPYLLGMLVTLLIIPIAHFLYYFLIQKGNRKIEFFYAVTFLITVLLLVGVYFFGRKFVWIVPRFWTLGLVGAYILPYQLFLLYRNCRKFGTWYNPDKRLVKAETKQFKKQGFQIYLASELHQTYAKHFRKHLAKGKSSESFYQKLEKDLRRDKVIAKWYWLFGVVVVLVAVIPVYLQESLGDGLIFTMIESALIFPTLFYFKRLIANGFQERERWLEKAAPYRDNLQEFFDKEESR